MNQQLFKSKRRPPYTVVFLFRERKAPKNTPCTQSGFLLSVCLYKLFCQVALLYQYTTFSGAQRPFDVPPPAGGKYTF